MDAVSPVYLLALSLPALPNLWGIWHAWHREFPTWQERFFWMMLCIFVPVFGGIAYLLFGVRRAQKRERSIPNE